jgi:hypothetical protein
VILNLKEEIMSLEKVVYTAKAKATGGRDGHATSDDGVLDIQLVYLKKWAVQVVQSPILNSCSRIFGMLFMH